jgi:hypothetical protein
LSIDDKFESKRIRSDLIKRFSVFEEEKSDIKWNKPIFDAVKTRRTANFTRFNRVLTSDGEVNSQVKNFTVFGSDSPRTAYVSLLDEDLHKFSTTTSHMNGKYENKTGRS